jgi:hypothetical protein
VIIWLYLMFAGSVFLPLSDDKNPLASPGVWVFGILLAIYHFRRWKASQPASPTIAPTGPATSDVPPPVSGSRSTLDMFHGVRNWTEAECPADVARATCALSGRDDAYLRSLLVAATLRNDESGRVIAAAVRRLLRPATA